MNLQYNQANPLSTNENWNVALQDLWVQTRQGSPSEVAEWLEEAIELAWEIATGGSGVPGDPAAVPWDLLADALTDEQLSVIKIKVLQDPEISEFIQERNIAMWNALESAILGEIEQRTAPVPGSPDAAPPPPPQVPTSPPPWAPPEAETGGRTALWIGALLFTAFAAIGLWRLAR